VASAASLIASRFRIPLLASAAKYGGLAALGYKLWELWREQHPSTSSWRGRLARRPRRY
jgi:hypothetical protein